MVNAALYVIFSIIFSIGLLIFLEYRCKAPRIAFFWGGMILGWLEMLILVKFII